MASGKAFPACGRALAPTLAATLERGLRPCAVARAVAEAHRSVSGPAKPSGIVQEQGISALKSFAELFSRNTSTTTAQSTSLYSGLLVLRAPFCNMVRPRSTVERGPMRRKVHGAAAGRLY